MNIKINGAENLGFCALKPKSPQYYTNKLVEDVNYYKESETPFLSCLENQEFFKRKAAPKTSILEMLKSGLKKLFK